MEWGEVYYLLCPGRRYLNNRPPSQNQRPSRPASSCSLCQVKLELWRLAPALGKRPEPKWTLLGACLLQRTQGWDKLGPSQTSLPAEIAFSPAPRSENSRAKPPPLPSAHRRAATVREEKGTRPHVKAMLQSSGWAGVFPKAGSLTVASVRGDGAPAQAWRSSDGLPAPPSGLRLTHHSLDQSQIFFSFLIFGQ